MLVDDYTAANVSNNITDYFFTILKTAVVAKNYNCLKKYLSTPPFCPHPKNGKKPFFTPNALNPPKTHLSPKIDLY